VCLSILGTWSGESEDEWRSSYSINYVLSAIQSLIMTAKPYHNEPGYEEVQLVRPTSHWIVIMVWRYRSVADYIVHVQGGEHGDPEEINAYSDKITHEVLRVAVCGMVEDAILGRNERTFRSTLRPYVSYKTQAFICCASSKLTALRSSIQCISVERADQTSIPALVRQLPQQR
jgi:hypothetical protein